MAITTVLKSCGHETSDWPLLYKIDLEFDHTYKTLLEGNRVPNFHPRMHYYVTWDTFVFLQVSVPR
jgi:hypothetical protein